MASVYAAAIHSSAALDMPRSRWIEGAATFTIVESSRFMIMAARTTAKPVQARLGGRLAWELAVRSSAPGRSTAVVMSAPHLVVDTLTLRPH